MSLANMPKPKPAVVIRFVSPLPWPLREDHYCKCSKTGQTVYRRNPSAEFLWTIPYKRPTFELSFTYLVKMFKHVFVIDMHPEVNSYAKDKLSDLLEDDRLSTEIRSWLIKNYL